MLTIAVMKKDEARRFRVLKFVDGVITMQEEGQDKTKDISRKSFTKGYKLVDGTLDDIKEDGVQLAPPVPALIASVDYTNPAGRTGRIATVTLNTPDIKGINEADFIADLVNNHGARHSDKVITDGGTLGHIDLNGDEPRFTMLNPPLLDESKATKSDENMVTFTYVASGRTVTMTRKEFYAMTTAVTLKEPKTGLPEDTLPDFSAKESEPDSKPPLAWNMGQVTPNHSVDTDVHTSVNIDIPVHNSVDANIPSPTLWNLQPPEHHAENSMRANRAAKLEDTKPFVPEPFFLRQSMIHAYEQCPDKMYDTYENGYNEESIFTRVGTAIHGLMEDFYNDRTINIGETFDRWWAQHATPEWDWYRDWRDMTARYFEKESKYEAPQVIATELEFKTMINGVPVSGTIDRVDRVDERTIRLVDYKTNFRAWTEAELSESIQFMMYTSAVKTEQVRQLLRERGDSGEFEVVLCTYEMLRLGYRQHTMFMPDELVVFEDWMKTLWTMILSGVNRKPKLNQYCGYCQKRHRCQLYMEVLNAPIQPVLTENTDLNAVVAEKERLGDTVKVLKGRLDEIDAMIKEKIAENKGSLVVGDYEWGTKAGTTKTYPAQDVFRILAMNGLGGLIPDLVSISNTKLQSALKDNKDVLAKIEEKQIIGYKQPSLNKKKIKK